jgi:hypothetical protein
MMLPLIDGALLAVGWSQKGQKLTSDLHTGPIYREKDELMCKTVRTHKTSFEETQTRRYTSLAGSGLEILCIHFVAHRLNK